MEKSTHKKNFDPEHMSPQEQLKFEIAQDAKVLEQGWRSLTSKESGRIGGMMTKRRRQMKEAAGKEKDS